jgi:hypothetical protein
MPDLIWMNSYPPVQVTETLMALADIEDAGFLFYCSAGRCFVVADTLLPASVDGQEPVALARADADDVFEDAIDQGAALCGCWSVDENEPDAAAA